MIQGLKNGGPFEDDIVPCQNRVFGVDTSLRRSGQPYIVPHGMELPRGCWAGRGSGATAVGWRCRRASGSPPGPGDTEGQPGQWLVLHWMVPSRLDIRPPPL